MATADTLHRTALYDVHLEEGARMVEFGGWEMPVQYTGIKEEHLAVRSAVGLFDLSHMGEIEVRGPGAFDLVDGLVTNDLSRIEPGRAQYTCLCADDGRILDDLLVYRFADGKLWLVVNASNREKVAAWMEGHSPAEGVEIQDRSLEVTLLAVQGPQAQEVLQPLAGVDLEEVPYYGFTQGVVAGCPAVISRTGYTGEDGFELYLAWNDGPAVWRGLRGASPDLVAVGLGARDTLRLEAGYSLYGHEIHEGVTPLEAGLGWVVRLEGRDFVGREALLRQKREGPGRTIVGLVMEGRAIPRQGYPVERGGRAVGEVTSGTWSPSLGRGIALASVESPCPRDETVEVVIRNRREPAEVVRPPFVQGSIRRGQPRAERS